MKTRRVHLFRLFAALLIVTISCALAGEAATEGTSESFPYAVQYELGDAEFAPGDTITIQQVRGTSDTIIIGGTYCVEGTYTLGSRDEADLAFYATTVVNSGPTPTDPKQHVLIRKGTGSFRLIKTMHEDSYPHISFYPSHGGSGFGGVYFGQGNRILHNKGFSYLDKSAHSPDYTGSNGSSDKPVSLSGPNQVLLEYLGNPVEPPANMDPRYTKEGLINAIQLAAQNVGITLKNVAIDDSEYPFLVGVTCGESDFAKLKDQIKKLDGYEYNGSIGSRTCNAFNIVPWRTYPPGTSQRITRRAWLRQQIFYDRLSAQK
jgi:hypothetical protein